MAKFTVGEEVRYDGEVYVVSARLGDGPRPLYRLLASRAGGTRFAVVPEDRIEEMESYLRPRDDTAAY